MNRREFFRTAGAWSAGAAGALAAGGCGPRAAQPGAMLRVRPHPAATEWRDRIGLAAGGSDPARNVQAAVEKLCGPDGVRTFVRPGDRVAVKPNIGSPMRPEEGGNVAPAVVARVVGLCLEAGAGAVQVFDNSVGNDSRCYEFSGIERAAREAGAEVVLCRREDFRAVAFDAPGVEMLDGWPIHRAAIEADVLINIAVAKTHALTGLTLCMKNLMGVQGGNRGTMHAGVHRKLADLALVVRPTLNVLDATRVMVRGGPTGGRRGDVVRADTVVCGTSAVTVDAWASAPSNLPWAMGGEGPGGPGLPEHVALGAAAGLGTADLSEIDVSA